MVLVIYNLMDVILPVKDSPCSITWIPLHEMSTFTFRVEEMVNLSVNTDHGFAMAGVDFVSTVVAQRNPDGAQKFSISKEPKNYS